MTNPLLAPWTAPFGLPPFAEVRAEDFAPAFAETMREHLAEIDALAGSADAATFDEHGRRIRPLRPAAGAHQGAVPEPDLERNLARVAGRPARDGAGSPPTKAASSRTRRCSRASTRCTRGASGSG